MKASQAKAATVDLLRKSACYSLIVGNILFPYFSIGHRKSQAGFYENMIELSIVAVVRFRVEGC